MTSRIKLVFVFTTVCVIWGGSWAVIKTGYAALPPFLGLGIQFSIAGMVLGLIVFIRHFRIPSDPVFWKLVRILTITTFLLPFGLIYWAQTHINSGLAAVLYSTFPLWVALFSVHFLPNESLSLPRASGVGLGFIGIIILFYDTVQFVDERMLLSMCAVIIAAIFQAYGLVALRRYSMTMNPVVLNLWPVLFSAAVLLLIGCWLEDISFIVWDLNTIGALLYLSIGGTVVASVFYFWLVKQVNVVLLSFSAFMTPVIALLFSVSLLNEQTTGMMIVGSCIVLVGLMVVIIGDYVHRDSERKGV